MIVCGQKNKQLISFSAYTEPETMGDLQEKVVSKVDNTASNNSLVDLRNS